MTSYPTGARKDEDVNKGRYDLLPTRGIKALAVQMAIGADKYAPNNWHKGIPTHRYLDSALRHLIQATNGENDEHHLAAAAFNILALIDHLERIQEGQLEPTLNTTRVKLPDDSQDKPSWLGDMPIGGMLLCRLQPIPKRTTDKPTQPIQAKDYDI